MRAVSLFSNCGAGDVGYSCAGFQFQVMAELVPHRLRVALQNHPDAIGVEGNLIETWEQVIERFRAIADDEPLSLLAACPPCQGMSSANNARGFENDADAGSRDKRNLLVTIIAQIAQELNPKLIVVENVMAFLTRKVRHPDTQEPISAAKLLVDTLQDSYEPFPLLVDLAEYGVPQTRKRSFITFVRRDLPILNQLQSQTFVPYPVPTHTPNGEIQQITILQALSEVGLPSLDASKRDTAQADTDRYPLHFVPMWDKTRYAMVKAIPSGSGLSAWQNNECISCGIVDVGDEDILCPKCESPLLRPIVQNEDGSYRFIKGFRNSSYRRMHPNEPANTVTTGSGHIGCANTIHPIENRLLSTHECAILQTFPHDFDWGNSLETVGHTNIRAMIGEAVPPLFTELHGSVLAQLISEELDIPMLSSNDKRAKKARRKLFQ